MLENAKERNTDSSLVFCGLHIPIEQSLVHLISILCIPAENIYFLHSPSGLQPDGLSVYCGGKILERQKVGH